MTEKQQADQIYNSFYMITQEYTEEIVCSLLAKQCAILHVKEIISFGGKCETVSEELAFVRHWKSIKKILEAM